jgi:hypothetical protein
VKRREESGEKKEEQADSKLHSGMHHPLSVDNAESTSKWPFIGEHRFV